MSVTQRARVLRLAEQRGAQGFTAKDFMPPTADGGPPIWRCAARVNEIRKAGRAIETRHEPQQGGARVARYVLLDEHRVTVSAVAPGALDPVLALPVDGHAPAPAYDPTEPWA